MFEPLDERSEASIRFHFDGVSIQARPGQSVAAALLASGIVALRTTPVSGVPRGPFCLMGACFECLVVVDGVANQQACMIQVRDGMHVATQTQAPEVPEHGG